MRQDQNTKASPNLPLPSPIFPTRPFLPQNPPRFLGTYPDNLIGSQLYSPNADFWKSRAGLPDPRAAFAAASNKVHEVKERALGRN